MAESDVSGAPSSADAGGGRGDGAAARARRFLGRLIGSLRAPIGSDPWSMARTVRQDLGGAFGHLRHRRAGWILAVALLGLYLLSGTYLVRPGEAAVVTRFGKIVQPLVTPGLHWRLPWPVETAWTVNVSQVRREGIGVGVPGHPPELHPPEDIQLLTGDENLLTAKAIVQYRVAQPADFLFRVDYDEDPLLRTVVKVALTELAGAMSVDYLLTTGRTDLQQRAKDLAQERLASFRSGIELVSIDLQEIAPPGEVAQAFRDVSSAAEEKTRLINDAQGQANSIIPQARGEAQQRQREAEGYRTAVVDRARGEAQRFADVLDQYQRDAQIYGTEVTRDRLWVETMEKVLPAARKYVVQPGADGQGFVLRLVDELPAPAPAGGGDGR